MLISLRVNYVGPQRPRRRPLGHQKQQRRRGTQHLAPLHPSARLRRDPHQAHGRPVRTPRCRAHPCVPDRLAPSRLTRPCVSRACDCPARANAHRGMSAETFPPAPLLPRTPCCSLRAVAFILGCGLGVLLRIAFVICRLAAPSVRATTPPPKTATTAQARPHQRGGDVRRAPALHVSPREERGLRRRDRRGAQLNRVVLRQQDARNA
ncbi:hypothetical protein C8J57DRAFT_668505 [Mycena rebaudengoi]|nr:hypothetical protein C8J57DRAFT_668505 [Mycena rebaudengoi]